CDRAGVRRLKSLRDQSEIGAGATAFHVGAQFFGTGLRPLTAIDQLLDLFLACAGEFGHRDCSWTGWVRRRRAALWRARKRSRRMLADIRPVISAISWWL